MDKASIQTKVGIRIKTLREEKKISQQELASLCDFEKSNMSRLEAGNTNPTLYTLFKICIALDISLPELFEGFEIKS